LAENKWEMGNALFARVRLIMYKLDNRIYKKCNNSFIITGGARNGTTILGKIFHSFENVEYIFEPPLLFSLFALIDSLNQENWKLLYETYLYEDFLMNALAGRNLNCNNLDDSSIYNVKSKSDIKKRQSISLRKIDAEQLAENSVIVWKIPDIVPLIPKFLEYYPKTKVIVIIRESTEVINSLIKKKWFSNEILINNNLIWPNRYLNGMRIPFWVKKEDDSLWCEMNELDRCAYYYITMSDTFLDAPNCKTVKYNDLVNNPYDTINNLSEDLEMTWGVKTEGIINTVRRTEIDRDMSILDKVSDSLRVKITSLF
jgi:hypothetical protein